MCTKGNPKFSCPTILSHSDDESLGSESDSREELFDSSLDTVNVSVNTELPMDSSHGSEEEEFDFLHLYEELSDYDFHRMMTVDDFTYSTAFSNEVFDNGEWYTYAGLETCNIMKSTRHGKELLSKSIQSATKKGDSGIDNLTCLSGDDTKLGTDHTKADVYESSNDMSESKSISEYQSESDSDLEDDFFSVTEEIEIFLESDDGEYFLAEESLEGTLDASFKSIPYTVVSYQDNLGLNDLDSSTVVRSSEVLIQVISGKMLTQVLCVFLMCYHWSLVTMKSCFPDPLVLMVPLLMQLTMLKIFLGDNLHLKTYCLQNHLMIVMMQILFGLF